MAEAAKRPPAKKRTTARTRTGGTGGRLRVKQVKSGIGNAYTYRRTLQALGLRHHQHEIIVNDTPSVRGMLHKVRHLVRVMGEA